ncbi:receptor-type adenylate cyclase GRESAG 4,putative [Trypanosoma brucei gambiense DAL972]|uniref:adenylate cyclase n=1 Tax=Trypanosoma brucei gambiense (strain MHOM/CI/86/DAL972) TaxID=679716 RepID=C9ZTS5_TRYB9|nr:receptor-type adenylate cyclase GRESAG 4,putative [Trypanosoma brucei gambiense DAL972]CBH12811.1 receptor-type adenylate cyclase GRESAG 4,putative [Trypanosoma brucei gambiense DAL972]|eukprot:XP_011775090.1 receptor-type adenylate cyclase GRESAG 4,putative [Trypanosoma brucei gambiense DAL972]
MPHRAVWGHRGVPCGTVAQLFLLAVILQVMQAPMVLCDNAEEEINVEVFSLLYNRYSSIKTIIAGNAGLNASFAARRNEGSIAEFVRLTHLSSNNESAIMALQQKLKGFSDLKKILVVLGPVGDTSVLMSLDLLTKNEVIGFAPYTGSGAVRGWRPNLYFISVDPLAETLALLRYALAHLRVRRLGFMYLKGVSFGDTEYQLVVQAMARMGYGLCGTFALKSSIAKAANEKDFQREWDQFAATNPQAVILFALPIVDGKKALLKFLEDKRTSGAYVLSPFPIQYFVVETFKKKYYEGFRNFDGQVITTGTNPLAKDNEYQAIQRFQKEMKAYLDSHSGASLYGRSDRHLTDDDDGELMVYGWIIGEMLSRALSSREWLKNRSTFKKSLYNQRRYVIDDLVYGDYGGDCPDNVAALGASCQCNQGGKAVYMKRLVEGFRLESVKSGFMALGTSRCDTDGSRLHAPLAAVATFMDNSQLSLNAAEEWHGGASLLVGTGDLGDYDRFFLHRINTSSGTIWKRLKREEEEKLVTVVMGVTDEALLSTSTFVVVDPVLLVPRLRTPNKRVIYLSATLEQQLFVIAKYLGEKGSIGVHSVISSSESYYINRFLHLVLQRFEGGLNSSVRLTTSGSVTGYLPREGDVFVIGLKQDDVEVIAKHLSANPKLFVYVPFTEVALYYQTFVRVFRDKGPGSSSSNRLLFATNLPHWADGNPSSDTVKKFHNAMKDKSKWTPLSLMGFAAGNLLRTVLPQLKKVDADTLSNLFFSETYLRADDMRYGPYGTEGCGKVEVGLWNDCVTNYGATGIAVWSMARALDPSVPPIAEPISQLLQYEDRDAGRLTGARLIGVCVGAVLFFLLLVVVIVVVLCRYFADARDNANAPKEPTDPVTLIFTDIESSTAQWAAHPEMMPDAVATHHRLIRALIMHYRCYEVKTVGDSFMIACRSPSAAVRLACDLQHNFLHHNWGTAALDESYREFELQRAEEEEGYTPPTAHLDREVYGRLWRGLRVRVGIHTGLCDIRYDEVTKGYDYYGRTANMAARTESVANGGQVLMTRATYMSLSVVEREQFDVTALGPVTLRGVPNPVEMYQLNPIPGRTFAALRLDRDSPGLDDEVADPSLSEVSSLHAGLTDSARQVAISLNSLLGVFAPAQRQNLLLPLCERWRVSLLRKNSGWSEAYCREVVYRIAVRVGRVADFRVGHNSLNSSTILMGGVQPSLLGIEVLRSPLLSRSSHPGDNGDLTSVGIVASSDASEAPSRRSTVEVTSLKGDL